MKPQTTPPLLQEPCWCFLWMLFLLLVATGCNNDEITEVQTAEEATLTVAETRTQARSIDGSYISWREHRIDDEGLSGIALRGADGLQIADLDGDGYDDIVSVHEDSYHVRIHFGSSDPDLWQSVTLASGDEVAAAEDASIGDLDLDGRPDIIVACELDHLIFFQNPGEDVRSGKWPRIKPQLTVDRGSWIRVFFADLDQDGDLEVTAPNKGDLLYAGLTEGDPDKLKDISWFEVEGDPMSHDSWKETVLKKVSVPINSRPFDLDQDGDLDIIAGSRTEARTFWFENLLSEPGGDLTFVEREMRISNRTVPQETGAKRLTGMNMAFADLNNDERIDIVLQETPFNNVWLEQPENLADEWILHPIGDLTPDSPTGVTLADIDGDNDLDLITGGYSEEPRDQDGEHITVNSRTGRLAWFENPGTHRLANPSTVNQAWVRHDISRRVRSMFDQFEARDMDGDGDIDFVTTRGNSGEFDGVLWLEQVRTPEPVANFEAARKQESRHLSLPR